ncbi:PREDICTED: cucumber peeling cupredoxin-like [Nicotiana attenuata]|uniref:Cucumber peeling cupredoxin n=1 Tax=Nicotiana attenuata TaxID=49451 RepID=A0A314KQV1_NICAT|nr:PREDICTED: cucumber peeling cupredoxin-like [Nicotiana attenuata]OIT31643.1 cucumber peeling cupredoxin [Nicotiana attenuata]
MDKMLCVIVFGALAVASLVQDTTAQTVHVVGDNIGWTMPNNGAVAYTNWAAGKTFSVGDTLVFNFGTNQHDVLQVQKTSFDGCNSQNAIGDPIMAGPANVTLDSAGAHYYICTFGRHCQNGQKLAITVSSTGTPGANPPAPSNQTTPVVPSPSSSTQPEACAPTSAAAGPSSSTPGGGGVAPPPRSSSAPGGGTPPPSSSSSTVLASFLLGLSSIVLAAFL